ncbi:Hypothetical protein c4081 [Escherichia coli CFT073]|uniref:Uncharacterized protein n=3 Tax=Enterobacteriaceae TaxID=543 RepID=A0A0H2VBA2_ECOL6|nr:Hypothetical protein c4081 [Escherichia coli CFT073]AAX67275.1 Hypothetical protein SCH_3369 [Salmonella enterica subsp. enterica serovar Choleraesuis str. SC-B67]ABE09203.1 hypothetical protein UTI89_C3766 [Escherichia coli UTI89]
MLVSRVSAIGHNHSDVAGALQDAICTTFCTRHNALHARAFVYENFRNFQIVNVSAIVVFSVSNGRFQNFLDQYSRFLVGVGQNIQSLRHFLTANQVSNKANLLSRRTSMAMFSDSFHLFLLPYFFFAFLSAAWPR